MKRLASAHTRRRKPHATDNKKKKRLRHTQQRKSHRKIAPGVKSDENKLNTSKTPCFSTYKEEKATRNRFKVKANKKMTTLQQSNVKKSLYAHESLEMKGCIRFFIASPSSFFFSSSSFSSSGTSRTHNSHPCSWTDLANATLWKLRKQKNRGLSRPAACPKACKVAARFSPSSFIYK